MPNEKLYKLALEWEAVRNEVEESDNWYDYENKVAELIIVGDNLADEALNEHK